MGAALDEADGVVDAELDEAVEELVELSPSNLLRPPDDEPVDEVVVLAAAGAAVGVVAAGAAGVT